MQSALQSRCVEKAQDLTRKLVSLAATSSLSEVPFTEIQEEIKARSQKLSRSTDPSLYDARTGFGRAGCSSYYQRKVLGQVIKPLSIQVINAVTNTQFIRPVVTMDQLEIIEIAEN